MFITVSALIISQMGPTLRSNAGTWATDLGYANIGGVGYNLFSPESGYNISGLVTDTWDHEADTNLHFDGSTFSMDEDITVAVIRDSTEVLDWAIELDPVNIVPIMPIGIQFDIGYSQENLFSDYIMVYVEFPLSIYTWDSNAEIALPMEWLYASKVQNSNQSVIEFELRNENYSLIVTTPGPSDSFLPMLALNLYTVQLGVSDLALAEATEGSLWTTVGRLATAQLPQTHWVINAILAVVFWTPIGFAMVEFLRRWIPFLP